jgi:hypothetical protein
VKPLRELRGRGQQQQEEKAMTNQKNRIQSYSVEELFNHPKEVDLLITHSPNETDRIMRLDPEQLLDEPPETIEKIVGWYHRLKGKKPTKDVEEFLHQLEDAPEKPKSTITRRFG